MARFVIFEPPQASGYEAAAKAILVRDGFSFWGFLIPPLWLLWHRLYIEAALIVLALVALGLLGDRVQGIGFAASMLTFLLSIYVGLEGAALRMAALRRRGWIEGGTLEADAVADAEIRYALAERESRKPAEAAPPLQTAPSVAARTAAAPALGLLTYPRGH